MDEETLNDSSPPAPPLREVEDHEHGLPFAKIALEKGYITRAEMDSCLREQRRLEELGRSAGQAQILVRNGFLSGERFRELMIRLPARMGACLRCGRIYDLSGRQGPDALPCAACGGVVHESEREPEPAAPPEGRTRLGKYALKREIGRGGMAVVYEAEDPQLKRRIALKILKEADPDSPVIRRLHREAAIAAQLQHPNIVGIHEVAMVRDESGLPVHYIAMDYVEGRSLEEVLKDKRVPMTERLRMLEDVARAVAYAHSRRIVHRDLKPGNVLVEKDGRVFLTDFGLAHAESFQTQLTKSNAVMGTPHYMAPEQVEGRMAEIDARTDVYALGVMLYEILAGRTPFVAETPATLYQQILHTEPPRPGQAAELEVICLHAMEKDRGRRYADASGFAEDLGRFRKGEPILARPPSLLYRLKKGFRKRSAIVGTVAAFIAAIGLTVTLLRAREYSRLRREARKAFENGDWHSALSLSEQALRYRKDDSVERMARESREKLDAEEVEMQRKMREAEAYRRLQERMKSLQSLIDDTRPQFYIASAPIIEKLAVVEQALRTIEEVAEDPSYDKFPDAWALIGRGWYFVADDKRAEEALSKADSRGSKDGWVHFYLGRIYSEQAMRARLAAGDDAPTRNSRSNALFAKAADHLHRPVEGWGGASEIDRQVAEAYRAMAENRQADMIRLCEEGLTRFGEIPGTEEYCCLLGQVQGAEDRLKQIDWCTKALARRPHYAWAFLLRAIAQGELRHRDEAIEDYGRALRLNPRLIEAYNNRAILLSDKGDRDGALADYDAALRIKPDFYPARLNRGALRHSKGDFDGALADLGEAIRRFPGMAPPYNNRANVYASQKKFDAAIADYETAARLDENYPTPHLGLAEIFQARGDLDRALSEYSLAIGISPDLVDARLGRAHIHLARGELDAGLSDLNRAIELDPKSKIAYVDRASFYIARRDAEAALLDIEKALEMDPKYAGAYVARANVRYMRLDGAGALADLETALTLNPRLPEALASRGIIRQEKGDKKGALEDYEKAIACCPEGWFWRQQILDRKNRLQSGKE